MPPALRWLDPSRVDVADSENRGGLVAFRQMFRGAGYVRATRGANYTRRHMSEDESDKMYGHCGIAWAARRDLLDAHRLYDRMILGGADNVMFQAMMGRFRRRWTKHVNRRMKKHLSAWADGFYREVRASVSFTDGVALTMYHGSSKARHYAKRYEILLNNGTVRGGRGVGPGGKGGTGEGVKASFFSEKGRGEGGGED